MSLKAFHLVFVTLATLACIGSGVWMVGEYRSNGGPWLLVCGVSAMIAGCALVAYGFVFWQKIQRLTK